MSTLSEQEIERQLKNLTGWTREGGALRKQYTFKDFPAAVGFVNRLVPDAESADHHPDIIDQLPKGDAALQHPQRRRNHPEGLRRRGNGRSQVSNGQLRLQRDHE